MLCATSSVSGNWSVGVVNWSFETLFVNHAFVVRHVVLPPMPTLESQEFHDTTDSHKFVRYQFK
jgi:hypothetical protein